jgi:hypothetical protein
MPHEVPKSPRLLTIAIAVAALISATAPRVTAAAQATVEELKARLSSTSIADRPRLCIEIAERQLDTTDKLYASTESEKAQAALTDVVAFSELARDYAVQSHKHEKQTEIAVRKIGRKLTDLKHAVVHDDQAAVQDAIKRLQRVSDDLLAAMFHKGDK